MSVCFKGLKVAAMEFAVIFVLFAVLSRSAHGMSFTRQPLRSVLGKAGRKLRVTHPVEDLLGRQRFHGYGMFEEWHDRGEYTDVSAGVHEMDEEWLRRVCRTTAEDGSTEMQCCPGYTGNVAEGCKTPICETPCAHEGKCIAPNTCSCQPGFTGLTCDATAKGFCWTEWLNSDDPSGTGDIESLPSLRISHGVCKGSVPAYIECQTLGGIPSSESSQTVTCRRRQGLICRHDDQLGNRRCEDYTIRFLCHCVNEDHRVFCQDHNEEYDVGEVIRQSPCVTKICTDNGTWTSSFDEHCLTEPSQAVSNDPEIATNNSNNINTTTINATATTSRNGTLTRESPSPMSNATMTRISPNETCRDVLQRYNANSKWLRKMFSRRVQCTVDGNYAPKQCHYLAGYCMCVDILTGEEIKGTRQHSDDVDCSVYGQGIELDHEFEPETDTTQGESAPISPMPVPLATEAGQGLFPSAAAATMATAIASDSGSSPQVGCPHLGDIIPVGQHFYRDCKKCSCFGPGLASCSKFPCSSHICYLNGFGRLKLNHTSKNGCTQCSCHHGMWSCKNVCSNDRSITPSTPPAAVMTPPTAHCFHNGHAYAPGDTFFNKCNRCRCSSSGRAACTKIGCQVDACYVDGIAYEKALTKSSDGCRLCKCFKGEWTCGNVCNAIQTSPSSVDKVTSVVGRSVTGSAQRSKSRSKLSKGGQTSGKGISSANKTNITSPITAMSAVVSRPTDKDIDHTSRHTTTNSPLAASTPSTHPVACHFEGNSYNPGNVFYDKCNACTCWSDSTVSCTDTPCSQDESLCWDGGKSYNPGATTRIDSLNCLCNFGTWECGINP